MATWSSFSQRVAEARSCEIQPSQLGLDSPRMRQRTVLDAKIVRRQAQEEREVGHVGRSKRERGQGDHQQNGPVAGYVEALSPDGDAVHLGAIQVQDAAVEAGRLPSRRPVDVPGRAKLGVAGHRRPL